jgi:hypothetical protein
MLNCICGCLILTNQDIPDFTSQLQIKNSNRVKINRRKKSRSEKGFSADIHHSFYSKIKV